MQERTGLKAIQLFVVSADSSLRASHAPGPLLDAGVGGEHSCLGRSGPGQSWDCANHGNRDGIAFVGHTVGAFRESQRSVRTGPLPSLFQDKEANKVLLSYMSGVPGVARDLAWSWKDLWLGLEEGKPRLPHTDPPRATLPTQGCQPSGARRGPRQPHPQGSGASPKMPGKGHHHSQGPGFLARPCPGRLGVSDLEWVQTRASLLKRTAQCSLRPGPGTAGEEGPGAGSSAGAMVCIAGVLMGRTEKDPWGTVRRKPD